MVEFPILYKKNSSGKLMFWEIKVVPDNEYAYPEIQTSFGQVDGKVQTTSDLIKEGKNQGKANETTVLGQALVEAHSKWEKQKKKGYVESKEDALAGIDEVLGFKPMLAQSFDKHGHKIKFPCAIQPKLDGIRCCAIVKDGKAQLFTRTGKPITAVPHIKEALEYFYPNGSHMFDGELYKHEFRDNFEKIVSLCRQQEPDPEYKLVEYHIYDRVEPYGFRDRMDDLTFIPPDHGCLKQVPSYIAADLQDVYFHFDRCMEEGYEGVILRNLDGGYEQGKRSYNLQKLKVFQDEEFPIIGVVEGRGKLMGHAASFTCVTPEGTEFEAKLEGSLDRLKAYFEDSSLWEGKKLTVKFQGYTNKNRVPRFPVGIIVRDYE